MPLPNNWESYLSLADSKDDLVCFLIDELCSHAPKEKEGVVAQGFMKELEARSLKVTTDVNALRSTHEELTKG